jgi:hypothetical protein
LPCRRVSAAFRLRASDPPIMALGSGNLRPGGDAEFTARASCLTVQVSPSG